MRILTDKDRERLLSEAAPDGFSWGNLSMSEKQQDDILLRAQAKLIKDDVLAAWGDWHGTGTVAAYKKKYGYSTFSEFLEDYFETSVELAK